MPALIFYSYAEPSDVRGEPGWIRAQASARTEAGVRFFGLFGGSYRGGCLKNPLSVDLFSEGFNSAVEKTVGIPPHSL